MINFIIVDDNKYVRDLNETIISKFAMPYDFNYSVKTFGKYGNDLKKEITTCNDMKIYILDLELPGKSGVDIAREIRKIDWDSIIIILTSHDELELKLLKEKLLILDFISKFDDYEKRLVDTLSMVINKINSKKVFTFKSNKELHQVLYDNIYYIYKDSYDNKTMIVTKEDKYPINESLSSIKDKLDNRFIQTHRACYVNIDRIKTVDFIKSIIIFDNDITIDYLSRNHKKELRSRL